MTALEQAFLAQLRELGVQPEDRLLLGFSGGKDSSALLWLLLAIRAEFPLTVVACHVHHGIRGEDADEDERFCAAQCQKLGVAYRSVFVDTPAVAVQTGTGLEETGRNLRYQALEKLRAEEDCRFLLTAHHADDQIETLLLHLARGSGLRGLCGIPPKRGCILRPLLSFPGEVLAAYCAEQEIPFREDESNLDERYSRNLIRKKLLPVLRQINPAVTDAATRLTALLREDAAYLSAAAKEAAKGDAAERRALPDPLLSRILDEEYRQFSGQPGLPYEALGRLCALYRAGNGRLSLPHGVSAICEDGELRFAVDPRLAPPVRPRPITEGEYSFPVGNFEVSLHRAVAPEKNPPFSLQLHTVFIKLVYADRQLGIRGFLPGDRLSYWGRARKVCELYRAAGIPPAARQTRPIFCCGDTPLLLPGIALADGVAALPGEECLQLQIRFFQTENP